MDKLGVKLNNFKNILRYLLYINRVTLSCYLLTKKERCLELLN